MECGVDGGLEASHGAPLYGVSWRQPTRTFCHAKIIIQYGVRQKWIERRLPTIWPRPGIHGKREMNLRSVDDGARTGTVQKHRSVGRRNFGDSRRVN